MAKLCRPKALPLRGFAVWAFKPTLSAVAVVFLAGFAGFQAVQAAEFSGVCPALGPAQAPYSGTSGSLPPSGLSTSIPPAIVLAREPVWLNVAGSEYPICSVYMSINQSLQSLGDQALSTDLIRSGSTPTELFFPDLRSQPWNQKSGANDAVAFSDGLRANAFWDLPNPPLPDDHFTWMDDGFDLLVNENPKNNQSQSQFSPYFLWDFGPISSLKDGKAQAVYFNKKSKQWQNASHNRLDPDQNYWFWVLDAPASNPVPAPLPLLGAGAALVWSRRLRQRLKQAAAD